MISKDGHLIFFNREYVNNKLCKLDRGTIDSFDSYKCVHIFIFISNFHSIITRMGLYHAITPSCVAYIKRYTVKVVIYAGGRVRIFWSSTIRLGIKYVDAWFATLKFWFSCPFYSDVSFQKITFISEHFPHLNVMAAAGLCFHGNSH